MTDSDLFTQAAAAREMGVTRQAVADRIAAGKIVPFESNGTAFVTRRDLSRWKDERARRARALVGAAEQ